MDNKKLNIVVLMGGPSAEHEVSLATARVVLNFLDKDKYNVTPILITKQNKWILESAQSARLLAENNIYNQQDQEGINGLQTGQAIDTIKETTKPDVVFIAMHGTFGEDGVIQGFLELAGVPYTGSGVLASALAMDKLKTNELYDYHGLKVPIFKGFTINQWNSNKEEIITGIVEKVKIPCVIKPSNCGSSVGISIIKDKNDLEKAISEAFIHDKMVIAQQYIKGREVTCAILDEGKGQPPIALPPTEIIPKGFEFFDYKAKYTPGATEEITPPNLPAEIISEIQEIAIKAHKILGCSGLSRTDMIVVDKDIFILETNTIPGMTETSLYPQAAKAVGISFPEILDKIIQSALRK
jgi:D-alanine-D-alanine ligase